MTDAARYEATTVNPQDFNKYTPQIQELANRFRNDFAVAQKSYQPSGANPAASNSIQSVPDFGFKVAVIVNPDDAEHYVARFLSDLSEPRSGMGMILVPPSMPTKAFWDGEQKLVSHFGVLVKKSTSDNPDEMVADAKKRLDEHVERVLKMEAHSQLPPAP